MANLLARFNIKDPKASVDDPHSINWDLPFNLVQWKAAHNSIERKESLHDQLEIGKCRALELDFFVDPSTVDQEKWRFAVQHHKEISQDSPSIDQILGDVDLWSKNHPGHVPITIHLDMKDSQDKGEATVFVEQLDKCILSVFSRDRIFTPFDLKGDFPTLLEAVRTHGWPTLQKLKDKFIFVLTGTESQNVVNARRTAYCETTNQRIAFVDLDQRYCAKVNEPECEISPINKYYLQGDRVFLNIQLGRNDWEKLAVLAHNYGFVTRLWKTNSHSDWKSAKKCKANFLATDKILGYSWAFMSAKCHMDIVPDPKFKPQNFSSSSTNNNNASTQ